MQNEIFKDGDVFYPFYIETRKEVGNYFFNKRIEKSIKVIAIKFSEF